VQCVAARTDDQPSGPEATHKKESPQQRFLTPFPPFAYPSPVLAPAAFAAAFAGMQVLVTPVFTDGQVA
jgi:hypothetical protein